MLLLTMTLAVSDGTGSISKKTRTRSLRLPATRHPGVRADSPFGACAGIRHFKRRHPFYPSDFFSFICPLNVSNIKILISRWLSIFNHLALQKAGASFRRFIPPRNCYFFLNDPRDETHGARAHRYTSIFTQKGVFEIHLAHLFLGANSFLFLKEEEERGCGMCYYDAAMFSPPCIREPDKSFVFLRGVSYDGIELGERCTNDGEEYCSLQALDCANGSLRVSHEL